MNFNLETKVLEAKSSSNKLILSANFDSIYIQIDTSTFQQIKPQELKFDTLAKSLTILTNLKIEEKANRLNPVFVFGKGAFVSIDNDSTKSKEVKINLAKPEDTGTLSIEISTKQKHFEVQLQDGTGKLLKSIRDAPKYTFKYLKPGDYKIAVIIDENNNGTWDAGSFYKKLQPEKVALYKNSDNKPTFPIRANWEVGPLVISF
jgi:hypothetical protein